MKKGEANYIQERTNAILDVIMAYARLEFNVQTEVSSKGDVFDSIAAGVNMLGEELENSVMTINEKEALLKEVHHRVKNNLQIISSLMNLQASYSSDPVFLGLIRECKNRISSMSIIHEMLYRSKDFSRVNAADYIEQLVISIESSFCMVDVKVSFTLDLDNDLYLETDRMIPIGLILNEVLSNSFKHAFPEHSGEIVIRLLKYDNGKSELYIKDNGIGLQNEDWKTGNTLGLQLIHTLSEQLDAEMEMQNEEGLAYAFVF